MVMYRDHDIPLPIELGMKWRKVKKYAHDEGVPDGAEFYSYCTGFEIVTGWSWKEKMTPAEEDEERRRVAQQAREKQERIDREEAEDRKAGF